MLVTEYKALRVGVQGFEKTIANTKKNLPDDWAEGASRSKSSQYSTTAAD